MPDVIAVANVPSLLLYFTGFVSFALIRAGDICFSPSRGSAWHERVGQLSWLANPYLDLERLPLGRGR